MIPRYVSQAILVSLAVSLVMTGCATGVAQRSEGAAAYTAPSQGAVLGEARPVGLRGLAESKTDTTHWIPFVPVEGPLASPIDASKFLDPPAGRHGFLTVGEDGHFYFEDGTPVRFFGVNIQAPQALPAHEEAERLAERLAQMGCNVVRLHHLDSPNAQPNIFDPAYADTQHLSAESLDRLDYFLAQLKTRGIYIYLDLLVSRKFKAGDGVPAYEELSKGAKVVAEFHPQLIQLQQQYARDLLTHENPYTNTRLVDEPAIVLIELINESSFFWIMKKRPNSIPPVYLEELRQLWVTYLADQGVPDPEQQAQRYGELRNPRVQQFYVDLQLRYFQQMHTYLRSLGLRIPIAGSNLTRPGLNQDLFTHASLDFIDRHAYWDHPKGGFGDDVTFDNHLLIEAVEYPNPVIKLSRERVRGKPFVVSEWNVAWPNEYRAVGPLLMAAYASFQDWDGLIQFNYQGELMPTRITSNFDVSTKPELFWQFPAASRLFHRRDVAPARERYAYPVLPPPKIPLALAFQHGIERVLEQSEPPRPVYLKKTPWVSDTGELGWDAKRGIVLIETSSTQAAIGRVGGLPIELQDATFEMTTPVACLILTSLDDQPLDSSRHLLLTTVARVENTGTVYNATRTHLLSSGTAPILMEPVIGLMVLPQGERPFPRVFVLDANGRRVDQIRVRVSEGLVEVPLGGAHTYELLFEAS